MEIKENHKRIYENENVHRWYLNSRAGAATTADVMRRNLFKPTGPDQLWETDITYIPTESGMTYPIRIKDCFTKEW